MKPFFLTNRQSQGSVQFQSRYRGASCGTDPHHTNPVPTEMQPPRVLAWVEQRDSCPGLRVGRLLSRAFSEGTRNAGQRQIVERGCTARVDRYDVIHMESGFLADLGQPAVFAAVLRSLQHLTPQVGRHGHVFRQTDDSAAGRAGEAGKGLQQGQPNLRPRASQPASTDALGPACRAKCGAGLKPPSAIETGPDRPASRLPVGWLETYASCLSAGHSKRKRQGCPRSGRRSSNCGGLES